MSLLFCFGPSEASAQGRSDGLFLSLGGAAGYAPTLTYRNTEETGLVVAVFGDLQYKKVIGRLQFTSVLGGTVDNDNFESGSMIHGSIGYNVPLTTRFHLPFFLSGGAAFISYNNSSNGGSGATFSDVSPQVGLTISPYYSITDHFALQAAARYFKGFAGGMESEPIDVADVSIGIRLTL